MRKYSLYVDDFIKQEIEVTVYGEGKPEVLITGAIHGGEATGIYAARKLMQYLEENQLLKGSVKVIPVANPTAFRRMERTSPFDNLDLNRIFPGHEEGTPSLRLAHVLIEESKSADYIVDLHCCGIWGYSYTLATWKDWEKARELANMLDIPIAVESGGTRGQLFVETTHDNRSAVIIELPGGGQGGVIDVEAGDQCFKALVNMLALMEMVDEEAYQPKPQFCDPLLSIRVTVEGLFMPKVKPGAVVRKDEVIGKVNDDEVLAPCTGTLTSIRPACFVFPGAYLGRIAPHV